MQTNNKKAFTLIELIFSILVISILAAVAMPKMLNIGNESRKSKVMSFVGTLNRTIGPTMWTKSLKNSVNDGKIIGICSDILTYTKAIKEVTVGNDCRLTLIDVPIPTVNSFEDGTAIESPVWIVEF